MQTITRTEDKLILVLKCCIAFIQLLFYIDEKAPGLFSVQPKQIIAQIICPAAPGIGIVQIHRVLNWQTDVKWHHNSKGN